MGSLRTKRKCLIAVKRHVDQVKPAALRSLSEALECCWCFSLLDCTAETISARARAPIRKLLEDSSMLSMTQDSSTSSGSDSTSGSDSGSDGESGSDDDEDSDEEEIAASHLSLKNDLDQADSLPAIEELPFAELPLLEQLSKLRGAWTMDEKLHRCVFELMGVRGSSSTRGCLLLNKMYETEWSKSHVTPPDRELPPTAFIRVSETAHHPTPSLPQPQHKEMGDCQRYDSAWDRIMDQHMRITCPNKPNACTQDQSWSRVIRKSERMMAEHRAAERRHTKCET